MGVGKVLLGAAAVVGGGALCFVTGGLAAPAIGAAVGSAMGLSGAAATSAGLAAIGGGALAAGGLGMAGGTAIISAVAAALGMTVVGGILTCAYLNRDKLLKIIRKWKEKRGKKALGAKVKSIYESGNYSKVKIGLTDENGNTDELPLQANEVASDVYEGLELTA